MRGPSGSHAVGVHDARLPDAAGGHRVRLFYPTRKGGPEPRGRARWLPRSLGPGFGDETLYGVMRYLRTPLPGLLAGLLKPVASQRLHAGLDVEILSGEDSPDKWPLVMFSHGLAGGIAFYSISCIDLASRGYVVAAVEHSDGSPMNSFFGSERNQVLFRFYGGHEVDGPEWEFRNKQLRTRVDDLDILREALRSASCPNGESLLPLESPELSKGPNLVGRIDFTNVSVAGHSFGGGSALEYGLRHSSDDHCPKRILCLDSWLFSLHAESIERTSLAGGLPKTCEVLFIDMELSIMEDSKCRREQFASGTTDFVTVVGAFHNNSSDFPAIVPRPLLLLQQLSPRGADPDAILAAQCEASAAFLNGTWPELREEIASAPNSQLRRLAIAERGSSDSVLGEKVKQK